MVQHKDGGLLTHGTMVRYQTYIIEHIVDIQKD